MGGRIDAAMRKMLDMCVDRGLVERFAISDDDVELSVGDVTHSLSHPGALDYLMWLVGQEGTPAAESGEEAPTRSTG